MPFTTLLIDLDDTVYPASSKMWDAIAARIDRYMIERLGIPANEITARRHELHARYGTTLRGLSATLAVDELDYLAFVHELPVRDFLTPDPTVRAALQSLTQRKWIFTNADRNHAVRVLSALALDEIFEDIIDIRAINPYCKPMPEAFYIALERAGATPQESVFVDDAPRNLETAREIGLTPVLLASSSHPAAGYLRIASLSELPQLISRLG